MRIAVLILSVLLGLVMLFESILVFSLSGATEQRNAHEAGAVGIFMAILWITGGAFVLAFPKVSVVVFAMAGMLGLVIGRDFPDLAIGGGLSLVLAVLSWLGWRGKQRDHNDVPECRRCNASEVD